MFDFDFAGKSQTVIELMADKQHKAMQVQGVALFTVQLVFEHVRMQFAVT